MGVRKARWAMWSLGQIAHRVIVEMRESDQYDIVAICSSSKEKAEKFIKDNELRTARAYDNIEDVLRRDDVDIVYIASPPWLHKDQCCKVMNAGKAVLVEKPMTLNAHEAQEIFECAEKNNVFCAEGVWTNYFPAMKKAKEWIDSGKIGEVVEVFSSFGTTITDFIDPTDASAWGNNLSTGGGSLMQFGPYNVNLAQFVFGEKPEDIKGYAQCQEREDGGDMNTAFLMTYDAGKRHTIISTSWTAKTPSEAIISGTKGDITLGKPFFCPYHAELKLSKGHLWYNDTEELFNDEYEVEGKEGFKYQFEAVSEYVIKGKTESIEVPHSYSIMLAETMQRIRIALGLE